MVVIENISANWWGSENAYPLCGNSSGAGYLCFYMLYT